MGSKILSGVLEILKNMTPEEYLALLNETEETRVVLTDITQINDELYFHREEQ
jgi:hypothetical protein